METVDACLDRIWLSFKTHNNTTSKTMEAPHSPDTGANMCVCVCVLVHVCVRVRVCVYICDTMVPMQFSDHRATTCLGKEC